MAAIDSLIERVEKVQHGFGDIKAAATDVVTGNSLEESLSIARALFNSEVHQARMLATLIFGYCAEKSEAALDFLRQVVSRDADWRVQEMLAQAFDAYSAALGYESALPTIKDWLADSHPNVRRAVSEGLRIWTTRPYFKQNPDVAIALLSTLKADESAYVRKSAGNALRDISRKHADLISAELATWDLSNKQTAEVYQLASKFIK